MGKNLLLGIGGSGSRIVESCLACFAAGLGPEDGVHVGLVDQDGQNGNAGRTGRLFKSVARFQSAIGAKQGSFPGVPVTTFRQDQFSWDERENIIWKPDVEDQPLVDLLNISNETREQTILFSHLFEQREATEPLPIGFKGHANVGAAATYAALMDSDGEFNRRLEWFMDQTKGNQQVRFFFAGSIFGGMGASGFPTIARRLRQLQGNHRNQDIRVGGVLMLPYFEFKDSGDDELALKSKEILQNARQALEFYADLLENEPDIFDRFYLAGWNDAFELDYWNPGGPNQINPPMVPELYAASAAIDFFSEGPIEIGPEANPGNLRLPIKISGRKNANTVAWDDVPGFINIRPALGRLLRLAAYWRYSIDPTLRSQSATRAEWHRLVGSLDHEGLQLLDQLGDEERHGVFDLLLEWAGSMRLFSSTDRGLEFGLWTADCVDGDALKPEDGVSLLPPDLAVGPLYDLMVSGAPRDACDLYSEINRVAAAMRPLDPSGIGPLVKATDTAARLAD